MSENKNVLASLGNKASIAGKEHVKQYSYDILDDIERINCKAVWTMSVGLDAVLKSFLLHGIPRWI